MRAALRMGARMFDGMDGWDVNFLLRRCYDFVKKETLRNGKGEVRCVPFSFLNKKKNRFLGSI